MNGFANAYYVAYEAQLPGSEQYDLMIRTPPETVNNHISNYRTTENESHDGTADFNPAPLQFGHELYNAL